MNIAELKDIPKYYIPPEAKAMMRPGSRVCWGASISQPEHQGRKAIGMIGMLAKLVEERHVQVAVLVNDTGNRHNYRIDHEADEASAHMKTYNMGQIWVDEHDPYFEYFGIRGRPNAQTIEDMLYTQWEYFLNNPRPAMRDEITRTQDAHKCIARYDLDLSAGYDRSAHEYSMRPGRSEASIRQFEEGKQVSREFLIEESGVLAVAGRRYDFLLYPKDMWDCHRRLAAGIINIPDDLTRKQIPDSVAAAARDGQTPSQAVIEHALGFERMRWIQVKRDHKKKLKLDMPKLEKILDRADAIARGGPKAALTTYSAVDDVTPQDMIDVLGRMDQPTRPKPTVLQPSAGLDR